MASDQPLDERVTVKQSGTIPVLTYHPAWVWRCNECGWLGTGLDSERMAIKEASAHMWDEHSIAICGPEMYGHPGHVWHHVKFTDAIDECERCHWQIGK